MMSLPDFKEKQILFISNEQGLENKIQFKNDNIAFVKDGKIINQISCYKVFAIFIIGDISITTILIKNCKKYGISLFLMKYNLEVYASFVSQAEGNYLLRMKQYSSKDELQIAKMIVKNKAYNQSILLKKRGFIKDFEKYNIIKKKIDNVKSDDVLRGIEGSFTKDFFKIYFDSIGWYKRMPRTKVDHINFLMDIGYTFLFNFTDALLALYGFDNYKGVYHKLFFQRKSLACDIMEPFRCLIDEQILKIFNLKQINIKDFKLVKGSYLLSFEKQNKYLKIFFECLMNEKESIFQYVRSYYYFVLNGKEMPFYKIK